MLSPLRRHRPKPHGFAAGRIEPFGQYESALFPRDYQSFAVCSQGEVAGRQRSHRGVLQHDEVAAAQVDRAVAANLVEVACRAAKLAKPNAWTSILSWPWVKSPMTSPPVPCSNTKVSLPFWPNSTSLPALPLIVSLPSPPSSQLPRRCRLAGCRARCRPRRWSCRAAPGSRRWRRGRPRCWPPRHWHRRYRSRRPPPRRSGRRRYRRSRCRCPAPPSIRS